MQQQPVIQPPQQPPRKSVGPGDFSFLAAPLLVVAVLAFLMKRGGKTVIPDDMPQARFATKKEIRKGNAIARKQIAVGKLTETAFELTPESGIKFAFSNPGGIVVGKAGTGKSDNGMIPLLISAIDQEHTIFVTDVEGELVAATAAYAKKKGYDIRVYAPGVEERGPFGKLAQFTGTFNFLDVMRHENDKAKALEITRGLNANTQEDHAKRHAYFGAQSDALLETALMLAKGSEYPDMLMVWAIITLPDLAERLDAAAKSGRFDDELSYFAKQSSAGLRAVAGKGKGGGDSPSASIQSSAFNSFSKFIDPAVALSLLPSPNPIPLEHKGKSIVYVRIDRSQLKATGPLGATGLHLWLNHNLDPQRHRDRPLTLISDEANCFIFPDLGPLTRLARKKGGIFWLGYQQDSGMEEAYGVKLWKSIRGNLGGKMYFNTGEPDFHELVSKSLGKKTIITKTASTSHTSKDTTQGISDQFKEVPLVPESTLSGLTRAGHCVVVSGAYPHPVSFIDKPIPWSEDSESNQLKKQCKKIWEDKLLPALQEENAQILPPYTDPDTGEVHQSTVAEEIAEREETAELLLPHPDLIKKKEIAAALAEKRAAEAEAKKDNPDDDAPTTLKLG